VREAERAAICGATFEQVALTRWPDWRLQDARGHRFQVGCSLHHALGRIVRVLTDEPAGYMAFALDVLVRGDGVDAEGALRSRR
jgi:hypothetical protein